MTRIYPYVGNGPYCFTNTLVSLLGHEAPCPGVVETLTGSPFGFQLLYGKLPLFDPYGWDPNQGVDQALKLLGHACECHSFQERAEAMSALREHLKQDPVFVGPLDMGLLRHQPESDRASGADHFVVVLEVQDGQVAMHDPQGHPWVSLPEHLFLDAWRAEALDYGQPYSMRTNFQRVKQVTTEEALRALLPEAKTWLEGRDVPVPPDTVGGAAGLELLADQVQERFSDELRGWFVHFSVRVGARRKADAAAALDGIGESRAADLLQQQARVLGALQFPALQQDPDAVSEGLRRLARLHQQLQGEFQQYAKS